MIAVDHLLDLLEQQQEILARLRALIHQERESLLDGNLGQVEEVTNVQSHLLAQQAKLSARIAALLRQLGGQLHLDGHISLAKIVDFLSDEQAHRVRAYYQEISSLAEDVQREGRLNWHLSQQALKYVEFTLRTIGRAKESPAPSYAPAARAGHERPIQLLMDSCA